ncbi:(2Fe-2S)-binding protein [Mesorhizobium sp. M8A.F.Ca.ET.173.01.1.1]|nr:(2Fe-2S)-binding protein [Mesorhizobium sp. M8A.F.Ca.ET.173.01.1.1]
MNTHKKTIRLAVNGKAIEAQVEPRMLLVEFLRHSLELTGTHIGCDTSYCGACTILLDGRAAKSCTLLAVQADGKTVRTVEGLAAKDGTLSILQKCFSENHALQCGFCTPGFLISATSLLAENPSPDETAVRKGLAGNTCRCTGYTPIVDAVLAASQMGTN